MKQLIIAITTFLFITSCGDKRTTETDAETTGTETTATLTDAQLKSAGITTGKMEKRKISSILKLSGKIDVPPQNMISISVPLGGYLKTSKLLPGMHVQKGEILAVMEDQQYIQLQLEYLTAKAGIAYLENEFKRQKELNKSQASSDKVYQKAEADYHTQKVMITSLAEKLKLAGINVSSISETNIVRNVNIKSPIEGYVSKVNVNIGKYVSPTEVMFELINPSDIHLALTVFEKDLGKLFIGQKLTAFTNNQPDKKHPCEIILIGKDLTTDRNTEVHCHFEDYDKTLVPGTYMNAEVEVRNKESLVLPTDAIVRFEGKQYVYKMNSPRQFEMMEVNVGETENGFSEIILAPNTIVENVDFVTKGAYSLLMKMKNKAG